MTYPQRLTPSIKRMADATVYAHSRYAGNWSAARENNVMAHLFKAVALAGFAALLFLPAYWSSQSTDGFKLLVSLGGWYTAGLAAVRTVWFWVPLGILLELISGVMCKRFQPWSAALIGGLIGCLLGVVLGSALHAYVRSSEALTLVVTHPMSAAQLTLPFWLYVGLWSAPYFCYVARSRRGNRGDA